MQAGWRRVLLLALVLIWTVGWGIRAVVELARSNYGWAVYSSILLVGGLAVLDKLRKRRPDSASGNS